MDDWNDPRLVLTIVRAGSLTSAARALGVNHSTAFRRLVGLERRLGARLFERLPAGLYAPTPAGERMAAAAERMEVETAALDRDILGADLRLSGRLKITCPETLAFGLLSPFIAHFRCAHPGIVLDMVVDNRVLSLSRREADVALRVSRPKEPDLHGRRIAELGWTLYGAPELLDRTGAIAPDHLEDVPLIGWEETVSGVNTADWLSREAPERAIVYRTNSVLNQMAAARAGIGLALLPCFLGDAEPGLRRATPEPLAELSRELWIVTHQGLRRTARVRAFMDLAVEFISPQRLLLSGRSTI